jgi:hypothetical protein
MSKMILAAIVLLVSTLAGCSRGPEGGKALETQYYFNAVEPGWRVQLIMNGQPVMNTASHGFAQEVGTFVVNGRNTVRLVADALQPGPTPTLDLRFGRVPVKKNADPGSLEMLGQVMLPKGQASPHFETKIEFDAAVPVRWTWEETEDLGALTAEDDAALRQAVAGIIEDYRRRDFKAIEAKRLPPYVGNAKLEDVFGPQVESGRKTVEAVSQYDDYTVTALAPDRLRCFTGSKVVLIAGMDDEPIVKAGHAKDFKAASGVTVFSLGQDVLRFARKDGRWCWLGN